MDYSKLNGIRTLTRSLGINYLLTIPTRRKRQKWMDEYNATKPKVANFQMEGNQFQMHVSDAYEYVRVQSFNEDIAIIKALKNRIKNGDTIWDIGSSIGLYSNVLAKFTGNSGKVVCFEPEKRSRERLLENIQLNKATNIDVQPVALGKENASATLAINEAASAGNHQIKANVEPSNNLVQTIEIICADDLLGKEKLKSPNVLKIDVEGHEENVLLGAKKILASPSCHSVMIEVHFSIFSERNDNDGPNRIKQHLTDAGFTSFEWVDSSHLLATK